MMFNTGDLILDAVILSIVARTPEGTYGYKITQDVRSKMDVPESTFYPLLKQMQMDGYLEVYHKDLGGRSRRFYKITEAGLERLEFCQQNWANYLQNAGALLMNGAEAGGAAVQETPQMDAAPMMEAQPQEVPQMNAAPMMEAQPQEVSQVNAAPMMEAQPQEVSQMNAAPMMEAQPQEAAPEFHIAGNGAAGAMDNFEFSIGGDDELNIDDDFADEGDLFELDSMNNEGFISYNDTVPAQETYTQPAQQMAYEQPAPEAYAQPAQQMAYEQPAPEAYAQPAQQMAYEQPAPEAYTEPAQQMAYEQPVQEAYTEPAQQMAYEQPAPEAYAEPAQQMTYEQPAQNVEMPYNEAAAEIPPEDDEADFLAEMAMGDIDEEELQETASSEEADSADSADSSDKDADADSDNDELQTVSELESLLSQIRSFETVFHDTKEKAGSAPTEKATTNINITDISGVASLLGSAPAAATAQPAPAPAEKAAPAPQTASVAPKPAPAKPVRYTEVRNKDTEDSLNSLVDLLKDDDKPKKRGFFSRSKSKSKNVPKEFVADSTPSFPTSSPTPVRSSVPPTPSMPQSSNVTPASASQNYSSANTAPAPKPAAQSTVRQVADNGNSVDNLADLLGGNTATNKNPAIFSKTGKSYTKVTTPQVAATAESASADIPKPSVSEPKVFKPTASKTFEAKAASPNARPVETTATITKPLEAKAISTKPTEAKPAEAKSVEATATVTPKADTAPEAQKPKEDEAIDSFKARLMQAHLLPDEK